MPGFILIDKTDAASLKQTLEALPTVGKVAIFECDDEGHLGSGDVSDVTTAMLVRVDGDARFARFAMERQGYATVRKAPWE